jgi:hypothetical protein
VVRSISWRTRTQSSSSLLYLTTAPATSGVSPRK